MKKILFNIFALFVVMSSCVNQEEIIISYQTNVTVSASHIFDSFQPVQSFDFDIMEGWNINLRSYVYDESGTKIFETNSLFASLEDELKYELSLIPGKYTIISMANFEGTLKNEEFHYWNVTGDSNINTFTVTEETNVVTWLYETLGLKVTEFEVDQVSSDVKVNITPVTALVQIQCHYDELFGGGVNDYSMYMPTCTEIKIMAETRTQTVKLDAEHNFVYGYTDRSSSYPIVKWNPQEVFENNGAPTSLAYRAFLPESNRTFKWSWIHNISGIIISEESEETTPVNFESGKQYDMDLVLDVPYLFVEKHDPQRNWLDRVDDFLAGLE